MGNPQERSLAWLAGILEAEGSISVQVYTLPDGRVRLTPYLSVVNCDVAILKESERILRMLCTGKDAMPRWCGHSGANKPCYILRLDGVSCREPLTALLPYMIGDKRVNASTVLWYIEDRNKNLFTRDAKTGRLRRNGYTSEQIDRICSIRTHKKAKSSETIRQAPNVN